MLVGNILSVQWPEVWLTGAIYVAIGLFHYVFRRRFLEISMDPGGGRAGRLRAVLGLSLLRLVRPGGDAFRRHSRRAAGVLLPDRPLGGGDAVLRASGRGSRLAG